MRSFLRIFAAILFFTETLPKHFSFLAERYCLIFAQTCTALGPHAPSSWHC